MHSHCFFLSYILLCLVYWCYCVDKFIKYISILFYLGPRFPTWLFPTGNLFGLDHEDVGLDRPDAMDQVTAVEDLWRGSLLVSCPEPSTHCCGPLPSRCALGTPEQNNTWSPDSHGDARSPPSGQYPGWQLPGTGLRFHT
ncbi:hypothetical protein EYF80_067698 [Liparis tanakae]|uniref:Uncharacterized protein n=1 Tax=Liparis tanakae TaxID=230148 RepID=A0A4Z2E0E8_9TELE|nr:hypothetical protein EYF80_067698 [Liparis tanakae]